MRTDFYHAAVRRCCIVWFWAAAAVFTAALAPATASEPIKTVTVIGTGDVYRDSIATAREKAISDSLVSAVKTSVADLLPAEALIVHFPTLNQVLFAQTGQFVQNYKVLTEFRHGGKYRVLVQASVLENRVIQELESVGITVGEAVLPRLLFLITEENPENTWPQYWWGGDDSSFLTTAGERALTETMAERGFPVVSHAFLTPPPEVAAAAYRTYLDNDEAVTIGSRLQADVVIVGTAVAQDALNTQGDRLLSFKGTVTLRALRVDTGDEIAATVQSAMATHADRTIGGRAAIARAGETAATVLADQIAATWHRETATPEMIRVTVTGTGDLAAFVRLRKAMSSTVGVNRIQIKTISGNMAVILVDYQSDADDLAERLMLNDFQSFGIHISDIEPGQLTVGIVPAPTPSGAAADN